MTAPGFDRDVHRIVRDIQDSLPDGVLVADGEGRPEAILLFMVSARIRGWSFDRELLAALAARFGLSVERASASIASRPVFPPVVHSASARA